jgi:hypothetical protein
MRTYPHVIEGHEVPSSFDIENAYVSPATVGRILSSVDGVANVEVRRPFSAFREVHVRFTYADVPCIVSEPYGDNSRYWIGSGEGAQPIDARPLEEAFKRYEPPFYRRLIGDLVSLRLLKALLGGERPGPD